MTKEIESSIVNIMKQKNKHLNYRHYHKEIDHSKELVLIAETTRWLQRPPTDLKNYSVVPRPINLELNQINN
jgi:hypothetical protein